MDTKFLLQLEFPGFVIFDPFNLDNFILKQKIKDSDILNYFIENPYIGDSAVGGGFFIPIYNIAEEDYTIETSFNPISTNCDLFTYKSFPLKITNNNVIIADMYTLINWNPVFLKKMLVSKNQNIPSINILPIENGDYSVDITGFFYNNKRFGYRIVFNNAYSLPRSAGIRSTIYEHNFNVVKLVWFGGKLDIMPYR